jgi:DNA-binding CsgD family transcriptional regulator
VRLPAGGQHRLGCGSRSEPAVSQRGAADDHDPEIRRATSPLSSRFFPKCSLGSCFWSAGIWPTPPAGYRPGLRALPPYPTLASCAIVCSAERRVLELLPTELSYGEIAARLWVSRDTVHTHVADIYRKLEVHSRSSAVARARQLNLLGT